MRRRRRTIADLLAGSDALEAALNDAIGAPVRMRIEAAEALYGQPVDDVAWGAVLRDVHHTARDRANALASLAVARNEIDRLRGLLKVAWPLLDRCPHERGDADCPVCRLMLLIMDALTGTAYEVGV